MTTYVALLRAINLGGYNRVSMAALRDLLFGLGVEEPRTLLQSGNAVFRAPARPASDWERLLESEVAARLGTRTDFMIRTAAAWKAIVAGNPFPEAAESDPSHLLVMCLKARPTAVAVRRMAAVVTGPEEVRVRGSEVYITYPSGIGRSRLTTTLLESRLGTRGTGRNWNTVLKLEAMTHEASRQAL